MKTPVWFAPWGWVYRPTAPAGWLLAIIAGLFSLQIIAQALLAYRSFGATVFVSFPYVVSAGTLLNWIASKTSQHPNNK